MIKLFDLLSEISITFNISIIDLRSHRRTRAISEARWAFMYLGQALTTSTIERIGHEISKDRSSSSYGANKCRSLMLTNPDYFAKINQIYKKHAPYPNPTQSPVDQTSP